MSFTDRLHKSTEKVWNGFHEHPFVKGIGDGSLDIEKFKFFMIQDYIYLYEYAKVFALGVVKSKRPEDMRRFAQNVDATLNGEMKIHRAYMKRLGISLQAAEKQKQSLANACYTSYMLSVGSQGTIAEITAAILACSWSYAEIGNRLNQIPNAAKHEIYGEWISGYASKEYQEQNDSLIALMNEFAADCSEEQLDELERIFINCSRCEAKFWDMAWSMEE